MKCVNARNLLFFVIALCMTLLALPAGAEIITGRIIDKSTGDPIPGVFIEVNGKDGRGGYFTIFVENTDSLGRFSFYTPHSGEATITFSYIGYHEANYTRIIQSDSTRVDLGDIKMRMDAALLKAVTIKAKRKQFYMHGDTVIYNPEAFNLKSGDRIAKLISRLPGVTVDEFGGISWLGKRVVMLLNGKESVATSTFLPQVDAQAVHNIQVYDKTTNNWGDTVRAYKVLDVRIKPSWMERWYGEAGVSGQTDRYYGLMGTAFNLSDKVPMQVAGAMSDGDGIYDLWRYSQERIRRDKTVKIRSHQVRADYQKQPEWSAEKSNAVTVKANLDHSDKRRRSESNSEQFLSDGNVKYGVSNSSSYDCNLQFVPIDMSYKVHRRQGLRWEISSHLDYGRNGSYSSSAGATFGDDPFVLGNSPLNDLLNANNALAGIALNSNMRKGHGHSDRLNTNARLHLEMPMKACALTANLEVNYSHGKAENYSTRITNYYALAAPSSQIDRQYSSTPSHDLGYHLNTNLSKQIKKFSVALTYINAIQNKYNKRDYYRLQTNDSLIEDMMRMFGNLENIPIEAYERDQTNSRTRNQTDIDNQIDLSIYHTVFGDRKGVDVRLRSALNHKHQRMHYRRGAQIDTIAHRNMLMPEAHISLSTSVTKQMKVSLSSSFWQTVTDFEQTMRYTDDTNPLYIVQGNPNLRNSSLWSSTVSTNFTIPKKQIMATLSATLSQIYNAQSSMLYYNPKTGGQRMVYDNISGGHSWRVGGSLDWKLSPKTSLRYTPSYDFNKSYRYLTVNEDNPEYLLNTQRMHNLVNNLSLRWYNDICELKFFTNTSLRKYSNTEGAYARYTYFDYNIGMNSSVEICSAVKVGLDVSLDGKNGYLQADMNKDRWLMDASVAIRMLRGKGTLTLSAIDILRQQTNRSYYVGPSSRSETRTYGLTDYYMLSFSYMFGKPKDK